MNVLARRRNSKRIVDRFKSRQTGTLFVVLPFLRQAAVIRKGAGLLLIGMVQGNLGDFNSIIHLFRSKPKFSEVRNPQ